MRSSKLIWRKIPVTTRYRYKIILAIALGWTVIDLLYLLIKMKFPDITPDKDIIDFGRFPAIFMRALVVFMMSSIMASLLFIQAQKNTIDLPLWINFVLRTGMLLILAFVMNFLNSPFV